MASYVVAVYTVDLIDLENNKLMQQASMPYATWPSDAHYLQGATGSHSEGR